MIEAHQVPPEGEGCNPEMEAFLNTADADTINNGSDGSITIFNPHGSVTARPGDWIIKGVKGEYYPCKPDIFEQTYAPAEVVNGNVIALAPAEAPVADERLVESMRGLLARAESGDIVGYVIAVRERDNSINFGTAVVPWDGITLSALLHDHMIQLMRTHGLAPK